MAQGNAYGQFCDKEFQQCLLKVNELMNQETCVEHNIRAPQCIDDYEQTHVKEILEMDLDHNDTLKIDSLGHISHLETVEVHLVDEFSSSAKEVVKEPIMGTSTVETKDIQLSEDSLSKRMDKIDVSNLTTTVNKFVTENNNSRFMKSIGTRINTIEDTVLNLSSTVTKFVDYVSKTKISQLSDVEKLKSKLENLN